MEGQGNLLKVGVTVVAAVLLLVVGYAFVQSEVMLRGSTYYVKVKFENALGISSGMKVKRAGTSIGQVEKSKLSKYGDYTLAKIRIKKEIDLYISDEFVITQESLLGGSFIDVYRPTPTGRKVMKDEEETELLKGIRQGGFNEIMQQTSSLIKTVEQILGPESLGGAISDITNRLDSTLIKVESLIADSQVLIAENGSYLTASMSNVQAISYNFLTMSQNLEEASIEIKELATDPNNAETLELIMADMKETSATLNNMMAQVDKLVSDPVVQQDAKDSVRLTKETLEEAKSTMVRFQTTLDGVDNLMGNADGALSMAKSKMHEIDALGEAIDVRTSFVVRGVDQDNDNDLGNDDYTVGDINATVAYNDAYLTVGADNIGQSTDANFMFGYGSLRGLSFRGGVYRGELGLGGAYYLPGGGGAEFTWYDTEDPKLNGFGYFPLGNSINLVVGVEDIENDAKPSVGLGLEL